MSWRTTWWDPVSTTNQTKPTHCYKKKTSKCSCSLISVRDSTIATVKKLLEKVYPKIRFLKLKQNTIIFWRDIDLKFLPVSWDESSALLTPLHWHAAWVQGLELGKRVPHPSYNLQTWKKGIRDKVAMNKQQLWIPAQGPHKPKTFNNPSQTERYPGGPNLPEEVLATNHWWGGDVILFSAVDTGELPTLQELALNLCSWSRKW